MAYKLTITEHAEELLDHLIYHLLYQLKNEQAAQHLLDEIGKLYERLAENPLQFPLSRDIHLSNKGYQEAIVPQMNYIVIFRIDTDTVNIVGIFHQLENYQRKI